MSGVSVIIPTYNSAALVTQAIASALSQTLPPSQVIVVDDGSKDQTEAAVAPFLARGVEYVRQENAGVSAARNRGVALAQGGYVAFLDADDVWHPLKLEAQLQAMVERAHLGLLGTDAFSWPGSVPHASTSAEVRNVRYTDLMVKNYFTASSVLVRRSALDAAGQPPFDRELQGPEDHDLWLRIAAKAGAGILKSPLTGYRSHLAGLGSQPANMEAGMIRILRKLDQRQAWNGVTGVRLRLQAKAYVQYSSALMYGAAGHQRAALRRALNSLLTYPMPYRSDQIAAPAGRARLFLISLLRLLRLKRPHIG